MSRYGRDEEPSDRELSISGGEDSSSASGHSTSFANGKDRDRQQKLEPELSDQISKHRDEAPLRDYEITESQFSTMADIGTFRAVTLKDLTNVRYKGDEKQALQEINNLLCQKLLKRSTSQPEKTIALTLTREGHRVLLARNKSESRDNQVYYDGFVKPREAKHDTAIYRLYQKEAEEITKSGGHITRVVLDFEVKKSLNRQLARLVSLPEKERADRKEEIAKEHGLTVVKGKIQIPDLRLEYEDRDHNPARVDLELATDHYRRGSLAAKSAAGFKIYASSSDAARLRPAIADPEIMQEIFSL
jgi:hypothetical protein